MNSPITTWREWRISEALDRGEVPRGAGIFEERATGLGRFRAGLRELDRRLSDPARVPNVEVPTGLDERVMREVESRARMDRSHHEERGFVFGPIFGSWQRVIGLALAAGLTVVAIVMPYRAEQEPVFEDSLVASGVKTPSPELALAGTGQAVVRLILGGPSAVVPTPIEPGVLEGTREMGERAMAALERFGQERVEPAREHEAKGRSESGSGRSNRRPGEPELRTNEVMPGVMLAMQVVSRWT